MDDRPSARPAAGILTGMVLRLDPRLPILWRTPSSVQVGADPAVAVLDEVSEGDARVLAALVAGVSGSGLEMLARTAGVGDGRREELLARLAPALLGPTRGAPGAAAVLGDSALARAIAGLLAASDALAAPDDAGLVVLVGDWVLAPADHLTWLNRDVPHLPVVVSESAVTVGPLVEPGVGPCLNCVQLAHVDADAAWPAVAAQLLGREPRGLPALELTEAAAFVARRVLDRVRGSREYGTSWRLEGEGVTALVWERHPECRCATPAATDWTAPTAPPASRTRTRPPGDPSAEAPRIPDPAAAGMP